MSVLQRLTAACEHGAIARDPNVTSLICDKVLFDKVKRHMETCKKKHPSWDAKNNIPPASAVERRAKPGKKSNAKRPRILVSPDDQMCELQQSNNHQQSSKSVSPSHEEKIALLQKELEKRDEKIDDLIKCALIAKKGMSAIVTSHSLLQRMVGKMQEEMGTRNALIKKCRRT